MMHIWSMHFSLYQYFPENYVHKLVSWLVLYGTFSTNRLYHAIEVGNVSHRAGENINIMQQNNERIQLTITIISSLRPGLYGDDPLATVRLPQRGLSANNLASNDNLTRTTKRQNTY